MGQSLRKLGKIVIFDLFVKYLYPWTYSNKIYLLTLTLVENLNPRPIDGRSVFSTLLYEIARVAIA